MRYYVDLEPEDKAWECYLVDGDSEDEPIAAFLDVDTASIVCQLLNREELLCSCMHKHEADDPQAG